MVDDWLGSATQDPAGERFGTLVELFVGRTTGEPEFGVVALDGGDDQRVVVPLTGARRTSDAVAVAFAAETARTAPRMQRDVEEIPAEVGQLIRDHFGVVDAPTAPTTPLPPARAHAGTDADAEVTLNEEQLGVETRSVATERVRVRKHVVTEDVTVTVTLRREELVIEREPIPATSHQASETDFPLAPEAGGEIEFVLHAEEPVVTKRVVPVERVRLNRNTITEERRITDTVRRERADVTQEDIQP